MTVQESVIDTRIGRSWCCRFPVKQVGKHWECTNCGAVNASDTLHRSAPDPIKTTPMSKEGQYVGDMLKEAA